MQENRLTDRQGNRVTGLLKARQHDLDEYAPLTHSLVICVHDQMGLFVFNDAKDEWVLPGGQIEAGESPLDSARRGLFETAELTPSLLEFYGIMEWRLGEKQRRQYGALYTCTLTGSDAKAQTGEGARIKFWAPELKIGQISPLYAALTEYVLKGEYFSS